MILYLTILILKINTHTHYQTLNFLTNYDLTTLKTSNIQINYFVTLTKLTLFTKFTLKLLNDKQNLCDSRIHILIDNFPICDESHVLGIPGTCSYGHFDGIVFLHFGDSLLKVLGHHFGTIQFHDEDVRMYGLWVYFENGRI